MTGPLAGRRIVVPEARELDLLARMLEREGALAIRCPLVAINDAPDAEPIIAWLRRFIDEPPADFVLMTGEGLSRLVGFAERAGLEAAFVAALAAPRKIARGPKPVRRLRMLGLAADIHAEPATSAGVVEAFGQDDLGGRRIAVQLYPDEQSGEVPAFLRQRGANVDAVLPYVYGSAAEDRQVVDVIDEMAAGRVDLIAFTSSPQVRRLQRVASDHRREAALQQAFKVTTVAAVGPVVARAIERAGGRVAIEPPDNFHMKPMIAAIVAAIGGRSQGR